MRTGLSCRCKKYATVAARECLLSEQQLRAVKEEGLTRSEEDTLKNVESASVATACGSPTISVQTPTEP